MKRYNHRFARPFGPASIVTLTSKAYFRRIHRKHPSITILISAHQFALHLQADFWQRAFIHLVLYRIYLINRPGRLLNFWTLRVGAYSRWALIRGRAPLRGSLLLVIIQFQTQSHCHSSQWINELSSAASSMSDMVTSANGLVAREAVFKRSSLLFSVGFNRRRGVAWDFEGVRFGRKVRAPIRGSELPQKMLKFKVSETPFRN